MAKESNPTILYFFVPYYPASISDDSQENSHGFHAGATFLEAHFKVEVWSPLLQMF